MPTIRETAYPRLTPSITRADLAAVYTPTDADVALTMQSARGDLAQLGFLVTLKTFQRLGYFVYLAAVPTVILTHVAHSLGSFLLPAQLARYDQSGSRVRHLRIIRAYLQVLPYGATAEQHICHTIRTAGITKEDLADLINVGIEELVRLRYELPGFTTLYKLAQRERAAVHRTYYQQVVARLSAADQARLTALFAADSVTRRTPWNDLKADPGNPTLTNLKSLTKRVAQFQAEPTWVAALADLPDVKVKHFAAEARTLDAARMLALPVPKRVTLAAALYAVQRARAHDDVVEMFLKRMLAIHKKARRALELYRAAHQQRTDALITTLRDLMQVYQQDGTEQDRLAALAGVIGERNEALLDECEAHLAFAGNNYFGLVWAAFKSHRATIIQILRLLTLPSTSQDQALEAAIQFLLQNDQRTGEWLSVVRDDRISRWRIERIPLLSLSWIPDGWWRLVTDQHSRTPLPARVNRRHFEACLATQILLALKSGDLYVAGGDRYSDPRSQQIAWDEYHRNVDAYGEQVKLPIDPHQFVQRGHAELAAQAAATDAAFPATSAVTLVDGRPKLRRTARKPTPEGLGWLERALDTALPATNILDAITDTAIWLNWPRFFGPISGFDAKLDNARERYIATVFCYGCQLGPVAAARALGTIDRRQLGWIDQRHITEANLDAANQCIIDAFHRFPLPQLWGSDTHASADGMKWELYERNLLAERHIRYGGYGGVGYYLTSSTYIALVATFIACGAWEGHFLLDLLEQNRSTIQPSIIHTDTQGQNEAIFGLASLMGFTLMPRIRDWEGLTLYRPSAKQHYAHIDDLFAGMIDWTLIATHLPDMLRVVLSIKAGRLTPSTVLRTLSVPSKNRVAQAFREWGRAKRTTFLLRWMVDGEMRAMVQAETNKSESFNNFTKWVGFGSAGVITENDRDQQRKMIKYNVLVANTLIFHTTVDVSTVLRQLLLDGEHVDAAAVTALSPYMTKHIDRFGRYTLDLNRQPAPVDYETPVVSTAQDELLRAIAALPP